MPTAKRDLLLQILRRPHTTSSDSNKETLTVRAQLVRRNIHAKSIPLPAMRAMLVIGCCLLLLPLPGEADSSYKPKRINKAIELLEQKQPTYYTYGAGGYEEGKALAKTWADIILYDLEHAPLDLTSLRRFMQGLVDGGPTPSGH